MEDKTTQDFIDAEIPKGEEPMTAITDAILAAWTFVLAIILFRRANGRRPVKLWAWAFVFIAITSLAGVYYHAFREPLSFTQTEIAWKVVPFSTGIAMLFFGWAAAVAWLSPGVRRVVVVLLFLVMAGCLVWAVCSNSFLVAVVESLPVLLALLIGSLFHWNERASRWIAAGVVVSLLGAVVQKYGLFGLEEGPFGKNDLFHLIELPAYYFLFRGGLLLEEWRAK